MIPVLFAFVGLAVDTGFSYLMQRQEQTAADAGALDAAALLDGSTTINGKAFPMAQEVVQANGFATAVPCATFTAGGQTVHIYAEPSCAQYTTQVIVKVPPDPAKMTADTMCGANADMLKYSCVQVDLTYLMPTSIEHLFGVPRVTIRVSSVAYNGNAAEAPGNNPPPILPPTGGPGNPGSSPPPSGPVFIPPVSCTSSRDGGGFQIGFQTPGAYFSSPPQPRWVTPNPTQAGAGAPYVWTFDYIDEWPLDAYTLGVYDGATAASGHYFSQGIWVNRSATTPPANNAPGPDAQSAPQMPSAGQDVSGSFYNKVSTAPVGTGAAYGSLGGVSDWVGKFSDGTTLEVNGAWTWGGAQGGRVMIGPGFTGNFTDTITFTMPASLVPAGSSPGFSAFLQDGDTCGDTALYETQTAPTGSGTTPSTSPSPTPQSYVPPQGPVMLDS